MFLAESSYTIHHCRKCTGVQLIVGSGKKKQNYTNKQNPQLTMVVLNMVDFGGGHDELQRNRQNRYVNQVLYFIFVLSVGIVRFVFASYFAIAAYPDFCLLLFFVFCTFW